MGLGYKFSHHLLQPSSYNIKYSKTRQETNKHIVWLLIVNEWKYQEYQ